MCAWSAILAAHLHRSILASAACSVLSLFPPLPTPQSASSGFGEVVRTVKELYGVQYVYCWHAMAGYWSGIMPGVGVAGDWLGMGVGAGSHGIWMAVGWDRGAWGVDALLWLRWG